MLLPVQFQAQLHLAGVIRGVGYNTEVAGIQAGGTGTEDDPIEDVEGFRANIHPDLLFPL